MARVRIGKRFEPTCWTKMIYKVPFFSQKLNRLGRWGRGGYIKYYKVFERGGGGGGGGGTSRGDPAG